MTCWPISFILERMLPDAPVIREARRKRAQEGRATTRRELLGLISNRATLARLLANPVRHGVADVLGIMGVAKHPPRGFHDTVLACSTQWGIAGTLHVAIDVLLGDADNPAAVLKHRLTQDVPIQFARRKMKLADLIQKLEETDEAQAHQLQQPRLQRLVPPPQHRLDASGTPRSNRRHPARGSRSDRT